MTITQSPKPFEKSRRQDGQYALLDQLERIQTWAHRAHRARERSRETVESLRELERVHDDFKTVHFRAVAAFVLLIATLLAVYWVDFLLFSSTAEYFAGRVFHAWAWVVPLVCLLSPALLLLIEVGVSLQRELAREGTEFPNPKSARAWTLAGILLAGVIPLLAVATLLAAQPATSDSDLARALRTQTAALAILAFAGHLLILFGGRYAHDAKAFLAFKARQVLLKRKARREGGRFEGAAQQTTQAFNIYYHRLRAYNGSSDRGMEVGPFDAVTRALINECFGTEMILVYRRHGSAKGRSRHQQRDVRSNQRVVAPTKGLRGQGFTNGEYKPTRSRSRGRRNGFGRAPS